MRPAAVIPFGPLIGVRAMRDVADTQNEARGLVDRISRILVHDAHRRVREVAAFLYLTLVAFVSLTTSIVVIARSYIGPTDAVLIGVLTMMDVAVIGVAAVFWIMTRRERAIARRHPRR